ncbi:MAG TPA: YCF48-related protein [Ramlibacter sp.]|nr:YCF48-related protein [Ramlibacter sp.]
MSLIRSLLLAACAAGGGVQAAPVADALERPAVMVRKPDGVVLLGAAQCGQRLLAVGERGVVIASDDAGASWRQAKVPVSVTLTAVRCTDAQTAWAVGHGGTVLASADGGLTWSRRLDGRAAAQLVLEAARDGGDAKALQEAQRLVADGPDKPLLDLHFFDARRGIVVGAYGLAFLTSDAGQSWQPWMQHLPNPKGAHLYALRVHGDSLLIAGEQGLVLHSADGGRSFRRLELPYAGSFFTAELRSGQEVLVAGLRGNIWRSSDGGSAWVQVPARAPVSITASTVLPDGRLLLANQAGQVFQLAGGTLEPVTTEPLPPLHALLAAGSGALLALGVQGAIKLPLAAPRP